MFIILFVFSCGSLALAQDDFYKFEISGGYSQAFNNGYVGDRFYETIPPNALFNGSSGVVDFATRERQKLKGFEASGVYNFSRYIGAKVDFSYHSGGIASIDFTVPGILVRQANGSLSLNAGYTAGNQSIKQYNYLAGIQIKDNSKDKRFKPFGHFLAGVQQLNARLGADDKSLDILGTKKFKFKNFTYDIGGGLDIRVSRRIDIRVIQFDFNPVFTKEQKIRSQGDTFTLSGAQVTSLTDLSIPKRTQNNFRIGFGVVFH